MLRLVSHCWLSISLGRIGMWGCMPVGITGILIIIIIIMFALEIKTLCCYEKCCILSFFLFHFPSKICTRFSSLETNVMELQLNTVCRMVHVRGWLLLLVMWHTLHVIKRLLQWSTVDTDLFVALSLLVSWLLLWLWWWWLSLL